MVENKSRKESKELFLNFSSIVILFPWTCAWREEIEQGQRITSCRTFSDRIDFL